MNTLNENRCTYLPMPEGKELMPEFQTDMFEPFTQDQINRAIAYINPLDKTVVKESSARILAVVRSFDKPDHECAVLITAKDLDSKRHLFKLYSNIRELNPGANWMHIGLVPHTLRGLSWELKQFSNRFMSDAPDEITALLGLPSVQEIAKQIQTQKRSKKHKL